MASLGVNIDHIANIREARRTVEPDPVPMAMLAELGGADGITVHLREDRRHIQDRDVELLRQTVRSRLNLEMAISKFSRDRTVCRSNSTSRSWMCRRSSRRWTVIPSAPPNSASIAMGTGSGSTVRRASRMLAMWSILTPKLAMEAGNDGQILCRSARGPYILQVFLTTVHR